MIGRIVPRRASRDATEIAENPNAEIAEITESLAGSMGPSDRAAACACDLRDPSVDDFGLLRDADIHL